MKMYLMLFLACFTLTHARLFEVGPDKDFIAISDVEIESLRAGDTLAVHARPQSYNEKWVLCVRGTAGDPVVVRGIADPSGNLPVISGDEAVTRPQINFWNESRGIIKIGGANKPADTTPAHIIVENLEIAAGRPGYYFTGRNGREEYANNAAAVYIEKGENITIRNCVLRDCGNGLFGGGGNDILVEGCYLYDNGIDSSIYEHNNYTEFLNITFQYNYFGPLREHCLGNNLKDRSAGLVVRYNWIEAGNRQLDLVDAGHEEYYTSSAYRSTFVYGNILVEPDGAGNSQVCHYGGDSGNLTRYRQGTLYFYNNTVVSTRSGNTTLVRLSSGDESADIRNNIIYNTAAGSRMAILENNGTVSLRNNWLKTGWRVSHSNGSAAVTDAGGNITGSEPGFEDFAADNYHLTSSSACRGAASALASGAAAHPVLREYQEVRSGADRADDGAMDMGAFEYDADGMVSGSYLETITPMGEKPVLMSITGHRAETPFRGIYLILQGNRITKKILLH